MEALKTEDRPEAAKTLRTLFEKGLVGTKDRDFADSLCKQYEKKGNLSDKQWYWVGKLIVRAITGGDKPSSKKDDYTYQLNRNPSPIFEFFGKAKEKLKKPGLVFTLKNDTTYKLYTKFDDIHIVAKDVYPGGWRLKISPSGLVTFKKNIDKDEAGLLVNLLRYLAKDIEGTVATHGKKSNICCMCSKNLEDPTSVELGYGPVCAKNWGLPYNKKAAGLA